MCEAGLVACNPLPPGRRRLESVGIPVATDVAIRDDEGGALPPGRAGEIWVRSAAVIAAYENNPAVDEQSFRDGWFKTGDLGYFDNEGYLFLTGRSKDLINRGGMKVSPTEIDSVLLQHGGVADAATFAVAHPTLGEDVVAAVVRRQSSTMTAQQLRDYLIERLAAFKVPSRIVLVPQIPRTAQGKVPRRELASAFERYLRSDFVAVLDPHEKLIAELFAEVLGADPVGTHDNFFDLGGDSLRAFQLIARVNAKLGTEIDAGVLFRRPTVAEFARELTSLRNTDAAIPAVLRSL
jgi:acyl carrier protein